MKSFSESLREATIEGYSEDEQIPNCFGHIKDYENRYTCEDCPLNFYCEEEDDRNEMSK